MFLMADGGAFTLLTHLTQSFPKKSKCNTSPSILMCSGLNVIAPTVSASLGSFSSPTLMLGLRISQHTVATFLRPSSSASRFLIMCSSIVAICLPRFSAFLNFSFSRFCLRNAESENQTYLIFPVSLSSHFATYILSFSQIAPFQFPEGRWSFGLERFSVTSASLGPSFHFPRCG